MPKRESMESRIISYFREEELSKAGLMFGLVKGEMGKRQPKKRKPRRPGIGVEESLARTKELVDKTIAKGIPVDVS